jgi:hypothetical protein
VAGRFSHSAVVMCKNKDFSMQEMKALGESGVLDPLFLTRWYPKYSGLVQPSIQLLW